MNADIFAEWWRCQEHRVLRTSSSYWYEASPGVFQAFPYHWIIQPSEQEITDFLRQNRAIALRYSTPVESPLGCISYHVTYEEKEYSLEGLDRRSRQNVRTGLKNCQVKQISLEDLAEAGWALEMDTTDRQKRRSDLDQKKWRTRCLAAAALPGFEAWGAFAGDRLVASLLTFEMEDCCEFISQQCHRDYLSARANNALIFVVTQVMINQRRTKSIYYTMESLDAPASVDEFKFRMGYTAKPLRQRVVFNPWIPPVLVYAGHTVLRRTSGWRLFQQTRLPKIKGMFYRYVEGRRSLVDQKWPQCIEHYRESIIGVNHG